MTDGESRMYDLRSVLIRDRWRIAIILASALVVATFFGITPTVPRRVRLFGMAVIASVVLGYPWATRIVDYLYRPSSTYIVDFDAQKDRLAVWELPSSSWRELDVTQNEIHPLQASQPTWEGRNYDPDENTVEGTWRGSATDLELVESRAAINDIRNDLEEMAREGLTIRVKQSSIVRESVKEITMAFLRDYEDSTIYSGAELQQQVDDAIENWELDESPQQTAVDDTQDDDSDTEPNTEKLREATQPKGDKINGNH